MEEEYRNKAQRIDIPCRNIDKRLKEGNHTKRKEGIL